MGPGRTVIKNGEDWKKGDLGIGGLVRLATLEDIVLCQPPS